MARSGKLSDLDGDVFLAMLAQALAVLPDEKGFVWITGKQILEYRCIIPIRKRPNREWRAGDRQEDLARIAACVGHLENIWISIRQWIEKGKEDKSSDRRKRKKSRRLYKHESRLIAISDSISQSELESSVQPSSLIRYPVLALAWRYQIGSWLEPFLKAPNRQVAWLLQQILHYDPYHEKWEKRLARYFTFHLRINAMKNSKTITRTVGVLIDELSLPTDRCHPEPLPESALQDTTSSSSMARGEIEADLIPLPEMFILQETMQAACSTMETQVEPAAILFSMQKHDQLCWLRAALLGLQRQIALAKNHPHLMHFFKKLDAIIRHVLVSHRYLHRWILNASPVIVGGRLVGWRLRVGSPLKSAV